MNASWLALLALSLPVAAPDQGQEAVRAGRDALVRSGDYPWYDRITDEVRRVEVEPVEEPEPEESAPAEPILPAGLLWWLAWIGVAVVLVVVVILLARAYLRSPPAEVQAPAAAPETSAEMQRLVDLPVAERGDFLDRARRLYEAGDFGEAIKYLYSHQLVQLDRHQLVRLARGKTNRQYLGELRPRPVLREVLQQTMIAFEDVFFGNHRLERERFEECWSQLGRFDALVTEGNA